MAKSPPSPKVTEMPNGEDDLLNETTPLLPTPSKKNLNNTDADADHIDPKTYLLLPALAIGVFLGAADQTIVISSYGQIGSEMNALNKTNWLATAYLLPLSSLQLLYGTLSTSFGIKPLMLFAYFTFGLGCLLCGVAQSMNQLIVARAIAGIAGGFNTLSSIVLSESIPLRKRGVWQAWRSLVFAVGLGAGSCGGWITETIGWRWSFLIQVPLVLIGFLNVCLTYHFTVDFRKVPLRYKLKRIDFSGAVLIIAAVTTMLLGFDQGSNVSWSAPATIVCLIASLVSFVAFFYVEARVAVEPFAPTRVLCDRTLAACLAGNFFAYGAWFGVLYYLPLLWQAVEKLSATQASVRLMPGVITGVLGSLLAGMAIQRTGRYYAIMTGAFATMTMAGILLILFTGAIASSVAATMVGYVLCSFTLNIGTTSTLVALMAASPSEHQAAALSCLHLFSALGSEFGLAICGAVLQGTLQFFIREHVASHDGMLPDGEVLQKVADQVRKSLTVLDDLDPLLAETIRKCYGLAVRWCFLVCAVFFAGALISSVVIKEKRIWEPAVKGTEQQQGEDEEGETEARRSVHVLPYHDL